MIHYKETEIYRLLHSQIFALNRLKDSLQKADPVLGSFRL